MREQDETLIGTALLIALYFVIRYVLRKLVAKAGSRFEYQIPRVTLIKRFIDIVLVVLIGSSILFLWGVERSDLLFFITSMLTVVGIAFFAQWSVLSNITSSVIIYFNHPVRVGDHIQILDKEFEISGRVDDIGLFFLIIVADDGNRITVPSNVFIQKMVKRGLSDSNKAD